MTRKIVLSLEDSLENKELEALILKNEELEVVDFRDIKNQKVTIIVNGPLTRLANVLMGNYQLINQIEEVLFVGGSATIGDVTPCAEKHVFMDVLAAKAVFNSGVKVVMFDLNVTRNYTKKALLPLAYLLDQTCFDKEECGIFVEAYGGITYGKTVCDILSDQQFKDHHCEIVKSFDENKVEQLIASV